MALRVNGEEEHHAYQICPPDQVRLCCCRLRPAGRAVACGRCTGSIVTDKAGPLNTGVAYVTVGMTWKASCSVVSPELGETLDLTG